MNKTIKDLLKAITLARPAIEQKEAEAYKKLEALEADWDAAEDRGEELDIPLSYAKEEVYIASNLLDCLQSVEEDIEHLWSNE